MEEHLKMSSPSSGVSTPETPGNLTSKAGGGKAASRPRWLIARRIIQLAALLLFSLPLIVAGWSLFGATAPAEARIGTPAELPFFGSLSSSSIAGFNLVDPFAALQAGLAAKEFSLDIVLAVVPLLLFYTLVSARAFCGWICPVNLVLEGVDYLRRKLRIKVQERVLPRHLKIGVAAAILLISALVSIPVFEVFSPISFINKGIAVGSTVGLVTFIAIIATEFLWGHRVWCRALCPVGGLYQVLGRLGFVNVRIKNEDCIHCGLCQEKCLADPVILDPALKGTTQAVLAGDCMLCGACIDACPTKALYAKVGIDHYRGSSKDRKHKEEQQHI